MDFTDLKRNGPFWPFFARIVYFTNSYEEKKEIRYKKSLESSLCLGSMEKLENDTLTYLNIMKKNVTSMYQGFKSLL